MWIIGMKVLHIAGILAGIKLRHGAIRMVFSVVRRRAEVDSGVPAGTLPRLLIAI
jgi:hypothetical protein